jgi:GTP cyclohydrolase I
MTTNEDHHHVGAYEGRDVLDDRDERPWERVLERTLTDEQWDRYQTWVAEIFGAFGMDLQTAGTQRTPERFLQALLDATSGYEGDPKLVTAFPTERAGAARTAA